MMKLVIKYLSLIALAAALAGCALPPRLPSEMPLLGPDLAIRSSSASDVKMLVFNSSNKLFFGLDGSGRIDVRLNGKALGSLDIGEYLQVQIPKGKHVLTLSHLDFIDFVSKHDLEATTDPLIVEIWATPISNSIKVHPEMPPASYLPSPLIPYFPRSVR